MGRATQSPVLFLLPDAVRVHREVFIDLWGIVAIGKYGLKCDSSGLIEVGKSFVHGDHADLGVSRNNVMQVMDLLLPRITLFAAGLMRRNCSSRHLML